MPYFCKSSGIYRLIKVPFNYFVVTEQQLQGVGLLPGCFSHYLHGICRYLQNITLLTFGDLGAAAFLVAAFVVSIYSVIFIWKSVFNRCK